MFDVEGRYLQSLPPSACGPPLGAAFEAKRGLFLVARPSNHRVSVYDAANGQLFRRPGSVAVDSAAGRVVVADWGNGRLQVLDDQGGGWICCMGTRGSEPGQFSNLREVAVDAEGRIYATDDVQHRVHVFDSRGDFVRTFGEGHLRRPRGVAVLDETGHVLVTSFGSDEVQVFHKADGSHAGLFSSWCTARPAFRRPMCVVVNAETRKVYVADGVGVHTFTYEV
ncbi:NHL repeat-containing protein [Acanthamoeba castellanii str. Neff]|uniref:NHL repeat-containing protein n=1 Tax=Acanthamoeba castellanii (strain ATCC 30010 / Neff) TaxID=1257118 RepID=L8HCD8_ACACF|nr:NHL repeat-containing protein [Acanthamoeba castellanii str. Neff]ELR22041.1 NHL repeat-containing protein [Acanthamoeba castellanii str. Neff]